jgi:hypothetical protein
MPGRKTPSRARYRKAKQATRAVRVERLPPSADAARDEGPRLLPLGDRVSEPSRLEHYLDLADAALGLKPGIFTSSAERRREQKKGTST